MSAKAAARASGDWDERACWMMGDAMQAAWRFADRLQLFQYGETYVVRDVAKPPDEQLVWSGKVSEAEAQQRHQEIRMIDRGRMMLAAGRAAFGLSREIATAMAARMADEDYERARRAAGRKEAS